MSPKCVLVTALYNIQRETKGDGLKWSDYLSWFAITLQINAPMVVFVESDLKEFVVKNRSKNIRTKIIVQPLKEIPCYKHLGTMTAVLKHKTKMTHVVSNKLPMYNIIQYSKFGWLREASIKWSEEKGDDNNDYVWLWIDAGISRFFQIDPAVKWPHQSWVNELHSSQKIWIQSHCSRQSLKRRFAQLDEKKYIGSDECLLVGTLFGGRTEKILELETKVDTFLQTELFAKKRMDNEQIALALIARQHPAFFQIVAARYTVKSRVAAFLADIVRQSINYWLPLAKWMQRPLGAEEFEMVRYYPVAKKKFFFSVGAMFKNESHILQEWLQHYETRGVDHFYLINDKSTDDFRSILKPWTDQGKITLFEVEKTELVADARGRQRVFYKWFLETILHETEWLAILDLDEFLYSPLQTNLRSILKDHRDTAQLEVNWVWFGSNGIVAEQQPNAA